MAIVPSQCGVRKCNGKVRKINEQRYQCLEKAHHHCFLVVAAAGGEEYEWTTRGWMHLKGKLAPSPSSEAKGGNESVEKPVGEKPALADNQTHASDQKLVESNIPQQPAEKQDAAVMEALVSIDEIVVPTSSPPTRKSSKEAVGQKNETDAVQAPQKSPTKTPPKTLLQRKREGEASKESSGCKKARSLDLVESSDTPPKTIPHDNVKKTSCEICEKPRSANQRGAACPSCLYALRQVAGHQSVQACRDDPSLLSKVKAHAAVEVQIGDRPSKRSKDTVETRLDRVENLLPKLLDHLQVDHL